MKIKTGRVFIDHHFKDQQEIEIERGYITHIQPASTHTHYDFVFPENSLLLPGFIDLHTHGAAGYDVMDASPVALKKISTTLLQEGVTGFLATTMTASTADIEACIRNVAHFKQHALDNKGADILGLHLEGPFINPCFMGAQDEEKMQAPHPENLKHWQNLAKGEIKILTLAPELAGSSALIKTALEQGIIAAMGHTAATFEESIYAIDEGISYGTHLFNAMSGLHHRTPGAAAAILMDERVTTELILDGYHVAPAMVRLAFQCKGLDKIVLITDSMRAKCLKNGHYTLGGQTVVVEADQARLLKNGALAGSLLHLNDALKNARDYTQIPLEKLIPLVTETPAKLLEQSDKIGRIQVGLQANFAVLDENLKVSHTFLRGEPLYSRV